MKKYESEKNVILLLESGWQIFETTNYNNRKILSYWLGKRGESKEYNITKKTRESLLLKNIIDKNNDLIK